MPSASTEEIKAKSREDEAEHRPGTTPSPRPTHPQIDEDDPTMPMLVEEEREEHIPPGPIPVTPKMTEFWQAVPRRILQPSLSPVKKEAPKASSPQKRERSKAGRKSRLCGTNRALVEGVWQTDACTHARHRKAEPESLKRGTILLEAKLGMATLRMAYLF